MRVAVTVEQCWHRVPGGTATSVLRTLAALCARPGGPDLVGVAARHAGPPPEPFAPPVPVRHLPLPRPALYRSWQWARTPQVDRATGPVDVLHATTFAIPPRSAPLVVTVHDLAFLDDPAHFTAAGNRFFRRGLALTKRHADLVTVPSRHTWDACVRAGIDEHRLRLVPWGVDAATVSEADVLRVRDRYGLHRPFVLWCGTLEPRKNLPGLLAAFARVAPGSDLDLVLVGPPGWGDAAGTGERPPENRVHTLGFVPDDDLHGLYAAARVFCYPSLREGFGMPVLEAMAHGTPVVTSTGTPMADLVGDAGRSVPPTDVDALADAITAVDHDRDTLGALARRRSAPMTWQATADATLAAYRDARRTTPGSGR